MNQPLLVLPGHTHRHTYISDCFYKILEPMGLSKPNSGWLSELFSPLEAVLFSSATHPGRFWSKRRFPPMVLVFLVLWTISFDIEQSQITEVSLHQSQKAPRISVAGIKWPTAQAISLEKLKLSIRQEGSRSLFSSVVALTPLWFLPSFPSKIYIFSTWLR